MPLGIRFGLGQGHIVSDGIRVSPKLSILLMSLTPDLTVFNIFSITAQALPDSVSLGRKLLRMILEVLHYGL